MESTIKVTKKERYEQLLAIPEVAAREELVQFLNDQITLCDRQAEKRKIYRMKKLAATNDELRNRIAETLSEQYQTVDEITAKVSDGTEGVTKSKVIARLAQMIHANEVVKNTIKVDKRRVMGYALNK